MLNYYQSSPQKQELNANRFVVRCTETPSKLTMRITIKH
ncbi:hypothetical protein SynMVIR181_02979 [Synechococcus sp. MVIR-18-1]|nr:hypothetical protein SynMVIR181_02979 [Synechococcus sp. MVIR-18-1]